MTNIVYAVWGLGLDSASRTRHAVDHVIDLMLGVLFPVKFSMADEDAPVS